MAVITAKLYYQISVGTKQRYVQYWPQALAAYEKEKAKVESKPYGQETVRLFKTYSYPDKSIKRQEIASQLCFGFKQNQT